MVLSHEMLELDERGEPKWQFRWCDLSQNEDYWGNCQICGGFFMRKTAGKIEFYDPERKEWIWVLFLCTRHASMAFGAIAYIENWRHWFREW